MTTRPINKEKNIDKEIACNNHMRLLFNLLSKKYLEDLDKYNKSLDEYYNLLKKC